MPSLPKRPSVPNLRNLGPALSRPPPGVSFAQWRRRNRKRGDSDSEDSTTTWLFDMNDKLSDDGDFGSTPARASSAVDSSPAGGVARNGATPAGEESTADEARKGFATAPPQFAPGDSVSQKHQPVSLPGKGGRRFPHSKGKKGTVKGKSMLNAGALAVWRRPRKDILPLEYDALFNELAETAGKTPLLHTHFCAAIDVGPDGEQGDVVPRAQQIGRSKPRRRGSDEQMIGRRGSDDDEPPRPRRLVKSVLFVPPSATLTKSELMRRYHSEKSSIRLYKNGQLISANTEDLLPRYLSFVVGVAEVELPNEHPKKGRAPIEDQDAWVDQLSERMTRRSLLMLRRCAEASELAMDEEDEDDGTTPATSGLNGCPVAGAGGSPGGTGSTTTPSSGSATSGDGEAERTRRTIWGAEDRSKEVTLYSVLEVDNTASQAEIRAAYLRKVKEYHPDKVLHIFFNWDENFPEIFFRQVLLLILRRACYIVSSLCSCVTIRRTSLFSSMLPRPRDRTVLFPKERRRRSIGGEGEIRRSPRLLPHPL